MANIIEDPNIMDSRKAAEEFISTGNEMEQKRKKVRPKKLNDDWTDSGVEKRAPLLNSDFTDSGIEASELAFENERKNNRKAVNGFLRAGKNQEEKAAAPKEEHAFDLDYRIRNMTDESFDAAVANGTITPEQIRKAAKYAYDVWMGDVWSETDDADRMPQPTVEEFYRNLDKYGYDTKDDYHKYSRYVKYFK